MARRTVYEGSIAVAAADYVHPSDDGDDDVAIDGLDELVTRAPVLRFTLDYPFEQPYEGTVVGDAGVTLREIIDAVRAGFRRMYRGAVEEDIPDLDNKHVVGDYGQAYHVIDDLVIEQIDLDEDDARLEIAIGS